MSKTRDEQIVFAISPEGQGDGIPMLLLGVPTAAWEYMKDGKTHMFDLTRAGLPIKLVIFGSETHDDAMKVLNQVIGERGQAYVDMRREDFSIKPKGEKL